ncbi:transcription elongation factor S-II [Eremomyces bilateralis CBS 781.70]|uniref:Transcription elongation factor n=1 Tax=Eremomyces bilateralis CBS 781.70 TaxID=1392243 RepID=A0A6G1G3F3_9PEZI|nr:transcription elongation factor S-II [Eremomyces bilateralis CBS 781.70]KAF1812446.1 transcription elongation factor S-II [Eremomyces bilateralis CBS 781.70]
MDKKEIELKGKAINKAVAGQDAPSTVIDILSQLRKGVEATEDILRSTKIGVTINRLRQNKDPNVATQASELVSKWKSDIKKAGSGPSTPKISNGTASPAPPPSSSQPKLKQKHDIAPDKRNSKSDNVSTQVTGNSTRDNCVKLMYDGLAHMSEKLPSEVLRIAREVEEAAYKEFGPETSDAYKTKMRSLYQNLKNKSNPGLRVRVLSGNVTPARFVVMTYDELKSDERRAEDAALQKENLNKAMVAQEEKSISTSLTCGKCSQKKVSYSQAQTRSADEPMTTFCECMNCGHRWKFS